MAKLITDKQRKAKARRRKASGAYYGKMTRDLWRVVAMMQDIERREAAGENVGTSEDKAAYEERAEFLAALSAEMVRVKAILARLEKGEQERKAQRPPRDPGVPSLRAVKKKR